MENDIYTRVTDAIVHAIESGPVGSWRMPWHTTGLDVSSPINTASRKPYRGINMCVIADTDDALYVRLNPELREPIAGGCDCEHCKKHPQLAVWDTLVIPKRMGAYTYRVHIPDPARFRTIIREHRAKVRAMEAELPQHATDVLRQPA